MRFLLQIKTAPVNGCRLMGLFYFSPLPVSNHKPYCSMYQSLNSGNSSIWYTIPNSRGSVASPKGAYRPLLVIEFCSEEQ